jgi:hypothetical protein
MNRKSESDTPTPFTIAAPEPRRPSGRAILFAGVAAACVLGVGLGLWARPGIRERQATHETFAKAAAAAPAASRRLEIVVDDHPRPAGAPIDVLPPGVAAAAPGTAPTPPAVVPVLPPDGLMRTRNEGPPAHAQEASPLKTVAPVIAAAFTGAKLVLARLEHPEPAPALQAPPPKPEPNAEVADDAHRAELAKAQARELAIARADAAKAEARRAELAKAEFDKAQAAEAERDARLAEAAAAKAEAVKAAAVKAQARKVELARAEAAKAAAAKAAAAKAEARKVELAKAEAAKAGAAKAAAAKLEARKVELAKAQAEKAEAHRQALARADAAKAHKLELAHAAQAEKAEQLKLAKAEARAKAAQREEARLEALADAAEAKKHAQLARLAHALAHAVIDPPAPVQQAKLDRKHGHAQAHEPKVQQASVHKRREPPARMPAAAHPGRSHPETVVPPPAPSGLMRVSSPRCASRDPGEALVCADPSLSAADHQLVRAYQGARNAGVPDAQLQEGQQRWLAARAAAAREAPWAVRDVYMARIAELNGQAKEAQGGY